MTKSATYTIEPDLHPTFHMLADPQPGDREAHTVYLVWKHADDSTVDCEGEFGSREAAEAYVAEQEGRGTERLMTYRELHAHDGVVYEIEFPHGNSTRAARAYLRRIDLRNGTKWWHLRLVIPGHTSRYVSSFPSAVAALRTLRKWAQRNLPVPPIAKTYSTAPHHVYSQFHYTSFYTLDKNGAAQ